MKKNNIIIMVSSIVVIILTVILIVLFIILPIKLNSSAKKEVGELINIKDKVENLDNKINTEGVHTDSELSQLENEQKELFNQKFVVYETKDNANASFASVSTMFSAVSSNNDINENRKVDINGIIVNSSNIDATKSCLDKNLEFKINCIYDDNGYVKTIELRYAQTVEEN